MSNKGICLLDTLVRTFEQGVFNLTCPSLGGSCLTPCAVVRVFTNYIHLIGKWKKKNALMIMDIECIYLRDCHFASFHLCKK